MKHPNYPTHNAKVMESFRGEVRAAIPLHPQELALVVIVCAHLCFLPWALGARAPWAQVTSLIFGLAAFVVGLWPRRYRGELAPQGAFVLHPWSRLLKFPIFWLGLLLFAYIACQGLNPAYLRATAGAYWWLAPMEHIEWLPSGVKATFHEFNAWRVLIIWGGAWALACALWAGITRRSGVQVILNTLVFNGLILALIGILQKVTAAKGVFWVFTSAPSYFVSSFYYKNHAGAYFNLMAALAMALLLWHHLRSLRRMDRSSPTLVYMFAFIVISALIFMSGSRFAMILLALYIIASICIFFVWRSRSGPNTTHPALTGLVACGVVGLLVVAVYFLNLGTSIDQFKNLATKQGQTSSIDFRLQAGNATLDLYQTRPVAGWGAGGFRHVFPMAQRNYPTIFDAGWGGIWGWDHAHNDYLETLMELGAVGFLLPVLILIWWGYRAFRVGVLAHPAFVTFLFGLGLPLAHAWVDFPLSNCAVFTTACASAILFVRWAELELDRP